MAIKKIDWVLVLRDVMYILLTLFWGFFVFGCVVITYEGVFGDGFERWEGEENLPDIYRYLTEFVFVLFLFVGFYRCTGFKPKRDFVHMCGVLSVFLLINCFYLFFHELDWELFVQNTVIMVCAMLAAVFL